MVVVALEFGAVMVVPAGLFAVADAVLVTPLTMPTPFLTSASEST